MFKNDRIVEKTRQSASKLNFDVEMRQNAEQNMRQTKGQILNQFTNNFNLIGKDQ